MIRTRDGEKWYTCLTGNRAGKQSFTGARRPNQQRTFWNLTAEAVAEFAASLDVAHSVLRWRGPIKGNLQNAARQARQRLIKDWAVSAGIGAVALGHTADDQAETFLMRLARGSGVEGLGAMEPEIDDDEIIWLRPMLHVRREDLRDYLREGGIEWADDPSNEDTRFDRVKMRQALGSLEDAGVSVRKIARTTRRLRSAKAVLFVATRDLARMVCELTPTGELMIEVERLISAQQSIRLRLLSEALRFVGAAYYAPRAHSVEKILESLGAGDFSGVSLAGCLLRLDDGKLIVRREPGRTDGATKIGQIWDDRWMVTRDDMAAGDGADLRVDAVGEAGIFACKQWRDTGFARESLLTTPGVWRGETLIAAPMAGKIDKSPECDNFSAVFCPQNPFFTSQPFQR